MSMPAVSDSIAEGQQLLCPAGLLEEKITQEDLVCTLCM